MRRTGSTLCAQAGHARGTRTRRYIDLRSWLSNIYDINERATTTTTTTGEDRELVMWQWFLDMLLLPPPHLHTPMTSSHIISSAPRSRQRTSSHLTRFRDIWDFKQPLAASRNSLWTGRIGSHVERTRVSAESSLSRIIPWRIHLSNRCSTTMQWCQFSQFVVGGPTSLNTDITEPYITNLTEYRILHPAIY